MIRLPPTGIDISANDLNFHLQQLDIYQGLLKQGFKRREIINYFKDQNAKLNKSEKTSPIPSTLELYTRSNDTPYRERTKLSPDESSPDPLHPSKSPSASPERPKNLKQSNGSNLIDSSRPVIDKTYAPRQSSLLQFSKRVSSDASSEDRKPSVRVPFSPRINITYHPRSETYSHKQSEIDENDLQHMVDSSSDDLRHLSLDDDLVPTSMNCGGTTMRIVSSLRPEAESFTPVSLRELYTTEDSNTKGKEKADSSSESDPLSMPSSPPLLASQIRNARSPSLPRMPRTPSLQRAADPVTARRQIHQQYLDGSFTVYDDAVPARFQPQTPADLGHGSILTNANAAFTAPPGMLRSPLPYHGQYIHGVRQPSGDQSPTTRALLIRERRQREFNRGARVEELRINRVRTEQAATRIEDIQALGDFWRDDLDADAVGEENFDELTLSGAVRRLRTISGNRRAQ